jgi:hypothetical protein
MEISDIKLSIIKRYCHEFSSEKEAYKITIDYINSGSPYQNSFIE